MVLRFSLPSSLHLLLLHYAELSDGLRWDNEVSLIPLLWFSSAHGEQCLCAVMTATKVCWKSVYENGNHRLSNFCMTEMVQSQPSVLSNIICVCVPVVCVCTCVWVCLCVCVPECVYEGIEDWWLIFRCIMNHVSPRLVNCTLTEKSCSSLASALTSHSSSLTQLNLTGNKLLDSGVELLCSALPHQNCKLKELQ